MTSEERLAGYKRALEENGLPLKEELIKEGDYQREKARKVKLKIKPEGGEKVSKTREN
ncbi:unnamed protein product [marine sediment metagenome]|uniref:Uncharacterized protein n=1 Tax=marine sediment metagenome TaxID=412755 RepID=X1B4T7_9ZZZZ